MTLTVDKALESLQEVSATALQQQFIQDNMDLHEQFVALNKELVGTLSVVTDLHTCIESLNINGYSKEWFDIVNEGNRFIALTNLEMPKFFGTDVTKKEACINAATEAWRDWLQKAWDVLKKIFEIVAKIAKELALYWTKVFSTSQGNGLWWEKAAMAIFQLKKSSEGAAVLGKNFSVEIPCLDTFYRYALNTKDLCSSLDWIVDKGARKNGNFWESVINGMTHTGDAVEEVNVVIIQYLQSQLGLQTDQAKTNGFTMDQNGVTFVSPGDIVKTTLNIVDDDAWNEAAKKIKLIENMYKSAKDILASQHNKLAANERYCKDLFTVAKNDGNEDLGVAQSRMQRVRELLRFNQTCNVQVLKSIMFFNNLKVNVKTQIDQINAQLPADAKIKLPLF